MTLEEMGIEVNGAAATIRGFRELLRGIDIEPSLDPIASEGLYTSACELFSKTVSEMLRYKVLLLWSEPDSVSVHVLDTSEECEMRKADAERFFREYPIPDSDNHELDEFARRNRFAREISFEQFLELTKGEFSNPNNYSISETGLEYVFEDRTTVINARAEGKL